LLTRVHQASELKAWATSLAERVGTRRARVGVARKLAVVARKLAVVARKLAVVARKLAVVLRPGGRRQRGGETGLSNYRNMTA